MNSSPIAIERLSVGQAAEITDGVLAGLRGTVTQVTADRRCALTISEFPKGIFVVIGSERLARCPENKPGR